MFFSPTGMMGGSRNSALGSGHGGIQEANEANLPNLNDVVAESSDHGIDKGSTYDKGSSYNSLKIPSHPGWGLSSGDHHFSRTNSDDSSDGPVTHYQQETANRD